MVRWSQLFVVPYPRSISLTGLFSVLRGVLTLHFFINLSFRSMTHHIAQGNDSSHCTGQWLIILHRTMTHHIAQGNDSSHCTRQWLIATFTFFYDLIILPSWKRWILRFAWNKHWYSISKYFQTPTQGSPNHPFAANMKHVCFPWQLL